MSKIKLYIPRKKKEKKRDILNIFFFEKPALKSPTKNEKMTQL
jgi:hypothetical protein